MIGPLAINNSSGAAAVAPTKRGVRWSKLSAAVLEAARKKKEEPRRGRSTGEASAEALPAHCDRIGQILFKNYV